MAYSLLQSADGRTWVAQRHHPLLVESPSGGELADGATVAPGDAVRIRHGGAWLRALVIQRIGRGAVA
jgi:hypothetical protein